MTKPALHLVKLCVGVETVADLARWQTERLTALKAAGERPELIHRTFQMPKRREELLAGGSLYWVIKGVIQARQRIDGLRDGHKPDGTPCAVIALDRALIPVRPVPRRPFQGWRYLDAADAPADLTESDRDQLAAMPAKMRRELAELGLI